MIKQDNNKFLWFSPKVLKLEKVLYIFYWLFNETILSPKKYGVSRWKLKVYVKSTFLFEKVFLTQHTTPMYINFLTFKLIHSVQQKQYNEYSFYTFSGVSKYYIKLKLRYFTEYLVVQRVWRHVEQSFVGFFVKVNIAFFFTT